MVGFILELIIFFEGIIFINFIKNILIIIKIINGINLVIVIILFIIFVFLILNKLFIESSVMSIVVI